ncbi:MAG TPA: formyltransferase [Usitatibacter sp.]|jgi:methionyl-tRNA formyltransferase|nr:formyltransferase [Usitatibacter sp.]
MGTSAVVFGYGDVGVRCLSVLLAHGIDVRLVFTYRDDPKENVWFGSVERLARDHGLDVVTPEGVDARAAERVAGIAPDFVFSFFYRHMLPASVLASARRGAYNMHGSLLPRFRGRAPVNWAVLHGARETGATLHEMVAKPDAGGIVDQMAVPILPDDNAFDVFRKVLTAAEIVLDRSLPRLIDGSARATPQDLAAGSYFGGRRPEDGRIDWTQGAQRIHDLVRAVAPPFPGAFTELAAGRLRVLRTRKLAERAPAGAPLLAVDDSKRLVARCADGGVLHLLECDLGGAPLRADNLRERLGRDALPLGESP